MTRTQIADSGYLTRNLTREAVRFMEANQAGPFFCYLAYNAVHNPIQAPKDVIALFANPDPKWNTYLAMLKIMDEGVGKLLDTIEELDLEQDTLIFFLSDNGGARGTGANNGRLRDFKHSVYEGGLRVPFLLRWPGRISAGTVSDEPVISQDVFATALAAAGVDPPSDRAIDSKNILEILDGTATGPLHDALYWNWIDKGSDNGWALRRGRWKLLVNKTEMELYDLAADIGETRNLVASEPEITRGC